jgi:hypothetical protein
LVTFFAAAKKVTAAAHSGVLINVHESKFPTSAGKQKQERQQARSRASSQEAQANKSKSASKPEAVQVPKNRPQPKARAPANQYLWKVSQEPPATKTKPNRASKPPRPSG